METVLTKLSKSQAKNIWIQAQKLNEKAFFGSGPGAVAKAVSHLGYVQIDTINVIERCHHHILFNRIPRYKRSDLNKAQTHEKSVFEYWTHALSYISAEDYRYFIPSMQSFCKAPPSWYNDVKKNDYTKVLTLLKKDGAISISDIKDDVLVEKTHAWGSAKPSKKALQKGFYRGDFVISERKGIIKKYDLRDRHFGWKSAPPAPTKQEYANYIIERGLRSQGIISLDSITHLAPRDEKVSIHSALQKRVKQKQLVQVKIEDCDKISFFTTPKVLENQAKASALTHILSPFDPLIIQRKRLQMLFDYNHIFEAYIPKVKRKYGYFSLPVLSGNNIIALLDLKTDRAEQKLLIQSWHWLEKFKSKTNKVLIESELGRFEKFQLSPE